MRVMMVLRCEVTCVEEEWRKEMKMRMTAAINWTDTSVTEPTVFRGAVGYLESLVFYQWNMFVHLLTNLGGIWRWLMIGQHRHRDW